jgi:N-acyl-D-aspartate/D-glutamate deacylase
MAFDLVIRGGRVCDGTGLPAYGADIGIRDGRIVKIGRIDGGARRTIDADGATVTPGFIDVHTHYDVQLDWDPLATPSSWHGTTTVLTGNCGFTLAPAKPEDVDWLAGMLSRVEGMSRAALRDGLRFRGGSFADYWRRFDGRLGVNVGSYVGHCAVRRWVMGDDASSRRASPAEVAAMQDVVRQAMRDGAMGFSTSQLEIHVGEDGRGVPCNHADHDEIVALAAVLAEFERGAIEIIPRSISAGYDDDDRRLVLDMARASGRPVELNVLLPTPDNPMSWERTLEFVREASASGLRLHPQFTTNELGLHLKLADTFIFDEMPAWRAALTATEPERSRRLRDDRVRDQLASEFEETGRSAAFSWEVLEVEAVRDAGHADWVGKTVVELAAERGCRPLDAFLDCSLAEDLQTQWQTRLNDVAKSFIAHVVRTAIGEPVVMAGSSDGGAHLASFVGADYTTRLLAEWVPDALTFEQAVWRLTGMPATVHALTDRGFVREGAWADLLVIDRSRLRAGRTWLARDFPADTERYVVDAEGYAAVIVNGEVLLEHGRHTGALPGHVLRGG